MKRICYNTSCSAGVAHPVERHLAKVEVASSSLVTRSIKNSHRKVAVFILWKVLVETRKTQIHSSVDCAATSSNTGEREKRRQCRKKRPERMTAVGNE